MRTVVIAAHGCPVWCLGAYGNEWIATPHLDRLAAEGVTFDRHYARHPDPLGGRADWWDIPVSRGAARGAGRPPGGGPPGRAPTPPPPPPRPGGAHGGPPPVRR